MTGAPFHKPQTTDDLILLAVDRPAAGEPISCGRGYYPEAFVRLRLSVSSAESTTSDSPELVAESSPLFWDSGTPAQVMVEADAGPDMHWSLSLTRWGVLRWELRRNDDLIAEAESRYAVQLMVDLGKPFHVGVTLRGPWTDDDRTPCRAAIHVGQTPGPGMHVAGHSKQFSGDGFMPVPSGVVAGSCANGTRPFSGTVQELFVANSTGAMLFDNEPSCTSVSADFDCGSCLSTRLLGSDTVSVSSGATFGATTGNYWAFFRLDDPRIRRVHLRQTDEMGSALFVSPDRMTWSTVPVVVTGEGAWGRREAMVELPERDGALYVAHAPVYATTERDRDLARAAELGASVTVAATSTLGNPVHVVTLTDPSTPLKDKRGIVLLCGQHSPLEQMGGRLGMPCIEELVRMHTEGDTAGLLKRVVFYWVPILNIDCAIHGVNGSDARRTNPNRCWFTNRGPEQEGIEAFFEEQEETGVAVSLMMDIHGGGMWRNHNILADLDCQRENPDMRVESLAGPDAAKPALFEALFRQAGLREIWWNGRSTPEKKRAPEWFQDRFGCPAFTLECSVVTFFDRAAERTRPFTAESYTQLGRDLGCFFAERAADSTV